MIQLFSDCVLMPRIFAVADWLWPLRTMRTASILNASVYRALGLPIVPSSLTEFYTLSARDTFFEGKVNPPYKQEINKIPAVREIEA